MTRGRTAAAAVYYGLLAALLLMAITGTLGTVFPGPVAKHLGEDSEGLLLALALPAWITSARPRLADRTGGPVTAATAVALLGLGLLLLSSDTLPGKVETLNEPVLALAVLIPYVQLRRPLPAPAALALPVGVLLLIALASSTAVVTDLAECLAMLVLVPVALDLVDRAVLDPTARPAGPGRWAWYAFLLLAPAAVALAAGPGATGALRYGERLQEAFLGVLLLELFLASRVERSKPGRHRAPAGTRTSGHAPASEWVLR